LNDERGCEDFVEGKERTGRRRTAYTIPELTNSRRWTLR